MKEIFSEKDGRVRILSLIATVLTVALGVFNGILNVLFFEEKIYMYQREAEGAWTVYYVLCTLAVVFYAMIYITNKRKSSDIVISVSLNENEGALFRILRLAAGVIFAVGAVMRFVFFFTEKYVSEIPEIVTVYMMTSFLILAFYFFTELGKVFEARGFTVLCGIIGVVALIVDTLAVYADMKIPIASEYRLFTAVYSVLFLLALALELRMRIAEPNSYGYLAMLSIASVVGGSTCIGRVISVIDGKTVSGVELARTVCGIGITVYFISRLLSVVFAREYLENCGGIPFETEPPINGEEIELCGGIQPIEPPIPENELDEQESEAE